MKNVVLVSMFVMSSLIMVTSYAQQAPANTGGPGQPGGNGQGQENGPGQGSGNSPGQGNTQGPQTGDRRTGAGNNGQANLRNVEANLRALIGDQTLTPVNPDNLRLPDISEAKPQLGKQLFFAKNLGGEQSVACVSCHHPTLGGGDDLSLPIGVAAVDQSNISSHNLLGLGRFNGNESRSLPVISRNAPTVFNLGLNNRALFWDNRVETGRNGQIITPDSVTNENGRRLADTNLPDNTTLAAAQARFPVTSPEEMRGDLLRGGDNQTLRAQLAQRFNNSDGDFVSNWPAIFAQAYGNDEVSFDKIADAIGEYERSMLFVNNPWQAYLNGDSNALTDQQKAGALVFFRSRQDGGAGCAGCHRGPTFSGNNLRLVAFPQFGPGTGNASTTNTLHDFGRENVTGDQQDRFHFRTPSLLNVAVTAPYGHTGAYQTLQQVVRHYASPRQAIDTLFAAQNNLPFSSGQAPFCQLPQIVDLMQKNNQTCENLYPDAYANSIATVDYLAQANNGEVEARNPLRGSPRLSPMVVEQVVAFLGALTDPCVQSRECLLPWIVDESNQADFPDDQPLIATDRESSIL